jgi:hypothetical protein
VLERNIQQSLGYSTSPQEMAHPLSLQPLDSHSCPQAINVTTQSDKSSSVLTLPQNRKLALKEYLESAEHENAL